MSEILGDQVDRLITVEMRPPGFMRGIIPPIYDQARRRLGKSLTLLAAEGLIGRIRKGDTVLITTGAVGPPFLFKGETDGPIGAAVLGRSLNLAFGAVPVYVNEPWGAEPIIAASQAAGVTVRKYEEAKQFPNSAAMDFFPPEEKIPEDFSKKLLDHYQPACLVAIEKLGPNEKGVIHSARGKDLTTAHARVDHLFREAKKRKILTIGIGDNGNEIGMGTLAEEVKAINPMGAKCNCPCGAGIADSIVTDYAIIANVSNWGAYGLAALLSCLLKRSEILHDPLTERRIIEDCVRAGALDGVLARQVPWVDGMPSAIHEALIAMLHCMVANELTPVKRDF